MAVGKNAKHGQKQGAEQMEQYTYEDGSDSTVEGRCMSWYMEEMLLFCDVTQHRLVVGYELPVYTA